jgi:hypothetical protein
MSVIPTQQDLAGNKKPYCLDTEWMLKSFLGMTKDEAIRLFQSTPTSEDFSYMLSPGLDFYLEAALDYLEGDEVANEEYGFPMGLLCSLTCQVTIWKVNRSVIPLIKKVAKYCEENTEKLELDPDFKLYQIYINQIKMAEQ